MSRIRRVLRQATELVSWKLFDGGLRHDDILLVSYPKSGTTWMHFLVAHAVLGPRLGLSGDWLNFRNYEQYVFDLTPYTPHDALPLRQFRHAPRPRLFLSHSPYDPRLTQGNVLYILRDPRDVLVSYYHHNCRWTPGFELSLPDWIRTTTRFPCDWDRHVTGWLLDDHRRRHRIHLVRYEELRRNVIDTLDKALAATGVRYTPDDLERAAFHADFTRMRDLEKQHPPVMQDYAAGKPFVRKGKVGGWRDELSEDDLDVIYERYGATMRTLGYDTTQRCNPPAPTPEPAATT